MSSNFAGRLLPLRVWFGQRVILRGIKTMKERKKKFYQIVNQLQTIFKRTAEIRLFFILQSELILYSFFILQHASTFFYFSFEEGFLFLFFFFLYFRQQLPQIIFVLLVHPVRKKRKSAGGARRSEKSLKTRTRVFLEGRASKSLNLFMNSARVPATYFALFMNVIFGGTPRIFLWKHSSLLGKMKIDGIHLKFTIFRRRCFTFTHFKVTKYLIALDFCSLISFCHISVIWKLSYICTASPF